MSHYNFIIENIEDIKCLKYFGTHISGLDININLFLKKKNWNTIAEYSYKVMIKNLFLLFSFSSNRYFNNLADIHMYKSILRIENMKYSLLGRLRLVLLIRLDLMLNRCNYISILDKRILMYDNMRRIRM
jgi:hypothetical protein